VEDEPLVRALAVDALEEGGFAVLEAPTADYALLILEKRADICVFRGERPRGARGQSTPQTVS
jgi:CheY-like chemotaxis protein